MVESLSTREEDNDEKMEEEDLGFGGSDENRADEPAEEEEPTPEAEAPARSWPELKGGPLADQGVHTAPPSLGPRPCPMDSTVDQEGVDAQE